MFQNAKHRQAKVKHNYNTVVIVYTTTQNCQFRVPKLTQNVALDVDTKNGWKQYKREMWMSLCIRGGERGGCGECCEC